MAQQEPQPAAPASFPPPRLWSVLVLGATLPVVLTITSTIVTMIGLVIYAFLADLDFQELLENPYRVIADLGVHPLGVFFVFLPAPITRAAGALLGAKLSPVPMIERLGLKGASRLPIWSYPLFMLGTLALGDALDILLMSIVSERGESLVLFARVFSGASVGVFVILLVLGGLLSPLIEELVFRGYIQRRLLERWHPALAILVSSFFFGVIHLDPIHGPLAFVIGLWLGVIAWRAGSIVPVIVCHIFNNLASALLVRFMGLDEYLQSAFDDTTVYRLAVCVPALVAAIVVLILYRGERGSRAG